MRRRNPAAVPAGYSKGSLRSASRDVRTARPRPSTGAKWPRRCAISAGPAHSTSAWTDFGTIGFGVSIVFDEDLRDELDFIGGREFPSVSFPNANFFPVIPGLNNLMVDSTSDNRGTYGTFELVSLPPGSFVSGTATFGTVAFRTKPANVRSDGVDVRIAVLDGGVDGFLDANGFLIPANFIGASVSLPEPATALLIAAGVLAVVVAGRRRN